MTASNISISIDSEIKEKVQDVFASIGLDMATAINIFLQQAIRQHGLPFPASGNPLKKVPKPGCMKGKIWMADDFDAPLEDFKNPRLEKFPTYPRPSKYPA